MGKWLVISLLFLSSCFDLNQPQMPSCLSDCTYNAGGVDFGGGDDD